MATVRASHLLVKHRDSRRPSSWKVWLRCTSNSLAPWCTPRVPPPPSRCLPLMHARLVCCAVQEPTVTRSKEEALEMIQVCRHRPQCPLAPPCRSLAWLTAGVTRLLRPQPHSPCAPLATPLAPRLPPGLPCTHCCRGGLCHPCVPGEPLRECTGGRRPGGVWVSRKQPSKRARGACVSVHFGPDSLNVLKPEPPKLQARLGGQSASPTAAHPVQLCM